MILAQTLYKTCYRNAESVLAETLSQVEMLSRDLKKDVPVISLVCDRVSFNDRGISLIKHVFTHILRNSMDHGIESPTERLSAGKSSQGAIEVRLKKTDNELKIYYRDDGRGLDLRKIKAIGTDKKLIHVSENDPKTISNLIFEPGFSTTTKVTDISGRGVGMNAVKSYLREFDCNIELILPHSAPNNANLNFEFILTLADDLFVS